MKTISIVQSHKFEVTLCCDICAFSFEFFPFALHLHSKFNEKSTVINPVAHALTIATAVANFYYTCFVVSFYDYFFNECCFALYWMSDGVCLWIYHMILSVSLFSIRRVRRHFYIRHIYFISKFEEKKRARKR